MKKETKEQAKIEELTADLQRTRADFENFRKQVEVQKENSQNDNKKQQLKGGKAKKEKKRGIKTLFTNLKGELKRVSWPTAGQVAKKTGIVIGVTLIFAVVLLGLDTVLRLFYNLLLGGGSST